MRPAIAAVQGFLPEGSMRRHDWIFDMLSDLQDYALANDLAELAASVGSTLAVARRETAGRDGVDEGNSCPAGPERIH
jgi:hypothetical protein